MSAIGPSNQPDPSEIDRINQRNENLTFERQTGETPQQMDTQAALAGGTVVALESLDFLSGQGIDTSELTSNLNSLEENPSSDTSHQISSLRSNLNQIHSQLESLKESKPSLASQVDPYLQSVASSITALDYIPEN